MVNHNRIKRGRNGSKLHVSHQDNLTVVLGKNNLDSGLRARYVRFHGILRNTTERRRIATKVDTVVHRHFYGGIGPWLHVSGQRAIGLWVGPVMLGSTPNFVQVVHGTFLRGLRSRLHVLGSVFYWALFGPDVSFGLGSSQLYSYRHQTLYRHSYGGIGSRLHVLGSGLRWALFGPYVSLGFGSGPLCLGRHE